MPSTRRVIACPAPICTVVVTVDPAGRRALNPDSPAVTIADTIRSPRSYTCTIAVTLGGAPAESFAQKLEIVHRAAIVATVPTRLRVTRLTCVPFGFSPT